MFAQPSRHFVRVGSLSLWPLGTFARVIPESDRSCGPVPMSTQLASLLGTLGMSDHSGSGLALVLADSVRSPTRDRMSSLEGSSLTKLLQVHGATTRISKSREPCEPAVRGSCSTAIL